MTERIYLIEIANEGAPPTCVLTKQHPAYRLNRKLIGLGIRHTLSLFSELELSTAREVEDFIDRLELEKGKAK